MTRWIKTPCDTNACVEVGKLDYGDYVIRNSQFGTRTVTFTPAEMRAFVRAVKNGTFDSLFEQAQ